MKKGVLFALILVLFVFAGCENGEENGESSAIEPVMEFEDVSPGDWFYRYVVAGLRFGLITAEESESHRFEPDRDVTQGEFITMLGRLHEYGHGVIGVPGEEATYYERYVAWALEMGIVHEYRYWDLMPCEPITREQKAVIICRYICIYDLLAYFMHDFFTTDATFWDYDEMSYWARGPVESLRYLLLANSRYRRYYKPHAPANRAEALAILSGVGSAVYDLTHPLRR